MPWGIHHPCSGHDIEWLPGQLCRIRERGRIAIARALRGLCMFSCGWSCKFLLRPPRAHPDPAGSGGPLQAEQVSGGQVPPLGVVRDPRSLLWGLASPGPVLVCPPEGALGLPSRQPLRTPSSSRGPAHFLTPIGSEPLVLLAERPGCGGVCRDLQE